MSNIFLLVDNLNFFCVILGFYAGIGPAVIGITPYIGLNFAFYETLKTLTEPYNDPNNPVGVVIRKGALGGIAGGSSKFLMYPLDTVKKRLQAQTLQISGSELINRTKYNGMVDCFSTIFREEGIRGFYRVRYVYSCFFYLFPT